MPMRASARSCALVNDAVHPLAVPRQNLLGERL